MRPHLASDLRTRVSLAARVTRRSLDLRGRRAFGLASVATLCAGLVAVACESDSDSDGTGSLGGAAGSSSESCSTEGSGTLSVTFTGLPESASGRLSVAGNGTDELVTEPDSLELPAGTYVLTGEITTAPDPLIRTAYRASLVSGTDENGSRSEVCIRDGEVHEVEVRYEVIPSSGKLFLSNRNGGAGPLLGFAAENLGESGSPDADVAADTRGAEGAFDREGNLWVVGSTTSAAPLLRYPASSLGSSGEKEADIELNPAIFGGGLPRATAIAFDADGNLWTNVVWDDKIIRFTPAQIDESGAPEPQVVIEGVEGPQFLAFDADGNLWTAHDGNVVRYDRSRLGSSTSEPPDLVLVAMSPPPVVGRLPGALGLAFDKNGDAWVNYNGTIARLDAAHLAGTGEQELTPEVQFGLTVTALPHALVFDEGGGLWLAVQHGVFGRISPDQLAAGGTTALTPETLIESPDAAALSWVGLFPAPAGLPLYHSY